MKGKATVDIIAMIIIGTSLTLLLVMLYTPTKECDEFRYGDTVTIQNATHIDFNETILIVSNRTMKDNNETFQVETNCFNYNYTTGVLEYGEIEHVKYVPTRRVTTGIIGGVGVILGIVLKVHADVYL